MTGGLEIRRYDDGDAAAVMSLLRDTLGWLPDAEQTGFFSWKHVRNPFGTSPAWVAVDGERVVGFRTFLRWEFEHAGATLRAVRAVDTATHADYRGRGLFSRLTTHALDELGGEGVDFVFNTPNDQSRPGYLKMGWAVVGRLPVRVRPRSPGSLFSMARSRVPADLASVPSDVGLPVAEVLADTAGLVRLLASRPDEPGLRTRLTPAFLRWRYGALPALGYRAVLAGPGIEHGVVVFRLRRRGPALEIAVCDVLAPGGDRKRAASLVGGVLRRSGGSYAVAIGTSGPARAGFLPLPRQGPVLAWRPLRADRSVGDGPWALGVGDVELF